MFDKIQPAIQNITVAQVVVGSDYPVDMMFGLSERVRNPFMRISFHM